MFNEKEPKDLPWEELGIDVVIESTGIYIKREQAMQHIKAGAKKVVITAPAEDEDITIVMGVNDGKYNPAVSITELVCEVSKEVTVEKVNNAFKYASQHELKGILGYSARTVDLVNLVASKMENVKNMKMVV